MSAWSDFFLASSSGVVQLETLEISHPSFSKVYRVVRNATAGMTARLEDGSYATFDYYPLRIRLSHARDNLDFGIQVDLGDLGEIIPQEIDRAAAADLWWWLSPSVYGPDSDAMFAEILSRLSTLVNSQYPGN